MLGSPDRLSVRATTFALALLLLLGWGLPTRADAKLREELSEAAKSIKKLLDGRGEDSIAVGQFTAPAQLSASAGPGIQKILAEELTRAGITIKARANLSVEGRYIDALDKESGLLTVHLKIRVADRKDVTIVELERQVFGDTSLASFLTPTVELPPDADPKKRSKKTEEALDEPKPDVKKTRIAAAPNSPYAVEILVKKSGVEGIGKASPAAVKDGLVFLPIQREEVYAVRLINDSKHDASVILTVDGLNMFTFSDVKNEKTGRPQYDRVVIPAGTSAVIKGWHRTNEVSEEFLVTSYSKSVAAGLTSTASIGTITAVFAAAWPENVERPPDEPKNPSHYSKSDNGTARGSKVDMIYVEPKVNYNFGVVRSVVSVRYTK